MAGMSDLYSIIFRGDILPGHQLTEVRQRMAQLFKLDDAKLATVFSGKPVVLKKDCDLATAEKMKAVLNKAGAEVEIKSGSPTTAPLAPPPPSAPKPVAAAPVAPPRPAAPSVAPPPPRPAAPAAAAPAPAAVPKPTQAPAQSAPVAPGGLKVAGVGVLMSEAERAALRKPPVQVKTDHISLEKRASNFMAADEKPAPAKRPEIKAPDFGVAAVGSDLLKDDEKRVFEELKLDLSGIQLAEVGADMLSPEDKIPLPVMEVAELKVDLAPAGSDMGEIKKGPPPPPPKIDHIKLS